MLKLTLAALIATTALAGCSSKGESTVYGHALSVEVPVRVAHEFYTSWGHDGRGGAALRKPTYQHVMGSEDMLMTTQGNYKELRTPKTEPATGNVVVVTALNQGMDQAIATALATAPDLETGATPPAADNSNRMKELNATADEYARAYRKFCSGAAMDMTEREWEIVALGGPSNIPAALRGKCLHSK